jgi:aminoglycoside phosphotransferase (APT) family kinase protein
VAEHNADNTFERVAQRVDPQSRLVRAWTLPGGVSAEVTALEIERQDGSSRKLLLRRHGDADLAHNPDIAADEFKLLQILHSERLATPAPLYFDESGAIFPTPYIVIEYIEGETVSAPANLSDFLGQLAAQLASIHAINLSRYDLSFLPKLEETYARRLRERPARLDKSLSEGRIRDALEAVWPPEQHNPSVLLHGDYWLGNTLWRDGQLVAVIDWEDAAIGDPLADLANGRLELLWAFGEEAMQRFTDYYVSLTEIDCMNLPYWDLCAALRPASKLGAWGLDEATEQRMRHLHKVFVTQALERLPVR